MHEALGLPACRSVAALRGLISRIVAHRNGHGYRHNRPLRGLRAWRGRRVHRRGAALLRQQKRAGRCPRTSDSMFAFRANMAPAVRIVVLSPPL